LQQPLVKEGKPPDQECEISGFAAPSVLVAQLSVVIEHKNLGSGGLGSEAAGNSRVRDRQDPGGENPRQLGGADDARDDHPQAPLGGGPAAVEYVCRAAVSGDDPRLERYFEAVDGGPSGAT